MCFFFVSSKHEFKKESLLPQECSPRPPPHSLCCKHQPDSHGDEYLKAWFYHSNVNSWTLQLSPQMIFFENLTCLFSFLHPVNSPLISSLSQPLSAGEPGASDPQPPSRLDVADSILYPRLCPFCLPAHWRLSQRLGQAEA